MTGNGWCFTTLVPECTAQLAGDLNGDCFVGADDLVMLMTHWMEKDML